MKSVSNNEQSLSPGVRTQARCFACGAEHPHGLGLRFRTDADSRVIAEWIPTNTWEGFEGIIHGGIVSTVLDEAMSKAVAAAGIPGLTCHLEVRLRHSIAPGDLLTVRGWVIEKRRRRVRVEAEIRDSDDLERAHGWATFLLRGHAEVVDPILAVGAGGERGGFAGGAIRAETSPVTGLV